MKKKSAGTSKAALPARIRPSGPRDEAEAAVVAHYSRKWRAHLAPSFKPSKLRGDLEIDHPDHNTGLILIAEALGGPHPDAVASLIRRLKIGAMNRELLVSAERVNGSLATIKGVEPRDAIELMIAEQLAALHHQVLDAIRRLAIVTTPEARDAEMRAVSKLSRAFAQLVEALKRHRSTGEQSVRVLHQHVHSGGQAVGIAATGGTTRGTTEIHEQPHRPTLTETSGSTTMPCEVQIDGPALSVAGDQGPADLPGSRGKGRRTEG